MTQHMKADTMTPSSILQISTEEGGIRILTLADPDRRNPVSHATRIALLDALSQAEADPAVRAVVLTGAGGQFCAGGDIKDQGERTEAQHRDRFQVIKAMVGRMVRLSKPLVIAVEGWAAGAGFALAMAGPCVVASRQARFTASFTRIGLMPDMGLLATLPARVGAARARQIILSNRVIDADAALDMGLVEEIAEPGQALARAVEIAREQAAAAPLPRQMILDWFARDVDAALDYECLIQPRLLNSADAAEGRAAFFEKRPPVFTGR